VSPAARILKAGELAAHSPFCMGVRGSGVKGRKKRKCSELRVAGYELGRYSLRLHPDPEDRVNTNAFDGRR
jgi:hypothetical protein